MLSNARHAADTIQFLAGIALEKARKFATGVKDWEVVGMMTAMAVSLTIPRIAVTVTMERLEILSRGKHSNAVYAMVLVGLRQKKLVPIVMELTNAPNAKAAG